MAKLDVSSERGQKVLGRFHDEQVIWLTTVNADGQPQSSPVWFLWNEDGFVIYSQPDTPKLRSIQRNERVSLNLNSSESGQDVVTIEGTARIVSEGTPGTDDPAYVEKYSRLIDGWAPDDFARSFTTAIRVTPTRTRSH